MLKFSEPGELLDPGEWELDHDKKVNRDLYICCEQPSHYVGCVVTRHLP